MRMARVVVVLANLASQGLHHTPFAGQPETKMHFISCQLSQNKSRFVQFLSPGLYMCDEGYIHCSITSDVSFDPKTQAAHGQQMHNQLG